MLNAKNNEGRLNSQAIDSERARHAPLVNLSHLNDTDQLQENIKIQAQSQAKSQTSELDSSKKSYSILDAGAYNLQKASHPSICVLTFVFKVSSFLTYLILGNFMPSVLTFILVLILSALDFWVVKNISGRLLVGLRWRNEYDQNEKEVWVFESEQAQERKLNKVDKLFFWASQVVFTIIWSVLLMLNVLAMSLFWALLVLLNFGLCGVNLYAYHLCKEYHKQKLKGLKKKYGKKAFQSVVQNVL